VVDLFGLGDVAQAQILVDVFVELFFNDLIAKLNTFIANVHARAGDQLPHLLLRLAAEATL
jgi:hypothetical protein